jgi:hypothetical protein
MSVASVWKLIGPGPGGTHAVVDVGLAEPFRQGDRVDPEIGGDLFSRHSRITLTGDPHHVFTELSWIGLRHSNILPVTS